MTRRGAALALAVGLLVAGSAIACGGSPRPDVTREASRTPAVIVSGTLTLSYGGVGYSHFARTGNRCRGVGGFSDVTGGVAVTVRNGSHRIIGVDRLEPGRVHLRRDGFPECRFPFVMTVPRQRFYEIEVGHRGSTDYTLAEVQAGPIRLTLH